MTSGRNLAGDPSLKIFLIILICAIVGTNTLRVPLLAILHLKLGWKVQVSHQSYVPFYGGESDEVEGRRR